MGLFKKSCYSNPYSSPCCSAPIVNVPAPVVKIVQQTTSLPNPDPDKFNVLRAEAVGNCLVLMVHYPDCTNFEGVKVMVYQGFTDLAALLAAADGKIDPHFCPHGPSPVARFKPDADGFGAAVAYAKMLTG